MESSFTEVKMHIEADQRQAEGMCVALQGKESPEGPCYFRESSPVPSQEIVMRSVIATMDVIPGSCGPC